MSKSVLVDLDFGNTAKPTNLPDPVDPQDAATKAYVDNAVEGLAWKDSVRVATTATLNLAGPGAAVDGVNLANNDRVLVKDQAAPEENGIYLFNGAGNPMTRAADASIFAELEQAIVTVEEGTSEGATFRQTELNGDIDVDAVSWSPFGTDTPAATETVAGKIEIATQGETDTGTDDQRAVTPQKLANWSGRKRKLAADVGDGAATAFNIDHNFDSRDVEIEVYRNSGNYDQVLADVTRPSTNRVTVTFKSAPAAGAFRVVVLG